MGTPIIQHLPHWIQRLCCSCFIWEEDQDKHSQQCDTQAHIDTQPLIDTETDTDIQILTNTQLQPQKHTPSKTGQRSDPLRELDLPFHLRLGRIRVQQVCSAAGQSGCRQELLRTVKSATCLHSANVDFFTEYSEGNRYQIQEVIGRGSYGVVCSALDTHTGEKVAIKKINDIFEHVSDATRILREIKLLRLLRHSNIVEIKHIMLPPSSREFKDIYVVFELMESDLHQVIKANNDLSPEHFQFFLYQLLQALKYIHTANVFHRDLKPKNILVNADCKLKICDFGLARVAFDDAPSAVFWTDYVATRWYRAPELCGSFFSKYTPAVDMWSIGCIFAEVLTGKPLFPGKNVVHQLDLMTDVLGTPSQESIARIRNEKAKRYLSSMRRKSRVSFSRKFPNVDPLAANLLEKLLAFDPKDRPTAEQALGDPYFKGLANIEREPSSLPISKLEFDFERRRLTKNDIRELIYREILEYHPQMRKEYLSGSGQANFMYPSAVDQFKRHFTHLEEQPVNSGTPPLQRRHASLPRGRVFELREEATESSNGKNKNSPHTNRRSPEVANGQCKSSEGATMPKCCK